MSLFPSGGRHCDITCKRQVVMMQLESGARKYTFPNLIELCLKKTCTFPANSTYWERERETNWPLGRFYWIILFLKKSHNQGFWCCLPFISANCHLFVSGLVYCGFTSLQAGGVTEYCSDIYIRQIVRKQLNGKAEGAEGFITVYSLICITKIEFKKWNWM